MSREFDDQVERVAALGEPVRRALYRFVVAQPDPVSREQAAAGAGVAHHVAKFHLERLVLDGLLDYQYARRSGRGGPGAGRPSKLYRRAGRDFSVSLPDRRYDLAGEVMAEAITIVAQRGVPMAEALRTAAGSIGRTLAARAPDAIRSDDPLDTLTEILTRHGYEPRVAGADVTLANCPFHRLAQSYTQLVCGINLDLVDGLLDGLHLRDLRPRLDPAPDRCCVAIGGTRPSPEPDPPTHP